MPAATLKIPPQPNPAFFTGGSSREPGKGSKYLMNSACNVIPVTAYKRVNEQIQAEKE